MTDVRDNLPQILEEHRKWRVGEGGARANLARANLARAGFAASLDVLRANAWDYESTEIPPHAWLVADAQAFIEQMDKAIAQARASVEAWS